MVYRVTTVRNGGKSIHSNPYTSMTHTMKFIDAQLRKALIDSASVEDHEYKRVEWPEIKKVSGFCELRLGSP
jgi:hypothetical protein